MDDDTGEGDEEGTAARGGEKKHKTGHGTTTATNEGRADYHDSHHDATLNRRLEHLLVGWKQGAMGQEQRGETARGDHNDDHHHQKSTPNHRPEQLLAGWKRGAPMTPGRGGEPRGTGRTTGTRARCRKRKRGTGRRARPDTRHDETNGSGTTSTRPEQHATGTAPHHNPLPPPSRL